MELYSIAIRGRAMIEIWSYPVNLSDSSTSVELRADCFNMLTVNCRTRQGRKEEYEVRINIEKYDL
jgi:hypothetical protein